MLALTCDLLVHHEFGQLGRTAVARPRREQQPTETPKNSMRQMQIEEAAGKIDIPIC
jgi:hypothetical protein